MKIKRSSHAKRRKHPIRNADSVVPESVTTTFIEWVDQYRDSPDPKVSYLCSVYLDKFVSSETDPPDVRRQRAINKWLAVERDNDATEERLLLTSGEYNLLPRVTFDRIVSRIQSKILRVLGDTVPVESLFGQFTGGATTTKSRTSSHPTKKYLGQADVTAGARSWFEINLDHAPLWKSFSDSLTIREVRGNAMFTVPKSTTIDRVAAKEPDLNMYLQRGVGNFIRRRLCRVGINLNDQSYNRELAQIGSATGALATIDLSSASDSVTYGLVELLLPPLWFLLLKDLRSPETLLPSGEWHRNTMFSSMGNGFTFELESLIFWAISSAVRDSLGYSGVVSVYGDDIIVESAYTQDLIWVLKYFGFTVNEEKTFASGPFRESCGGHYFLGRDITPFYLRRPISRLRDAIKMANQIRQWSGTGNVSVLDDTLEDLWIYLKDIIPTKFHGGSELGSTDQLVSDDPPHSRLQTVSKEYQNGPGGYLFWLDSLGDSSTVRREGFTSSLRREVSSLSVPRRVRAPRARVSACFLSEYAKYSTDQVTGPRGGGVTAPISAA